MKRAKTKFFSIAILFQLFSVSTTSLSQPAWMQKKSLDNDHYRGCNFVIGDKAYIGLGQKEKNGAPIKDFYEFNPSANTWTKIADFPGQARYYAIAFSLNNKGYVGLGTDGTNMFKDFWEYNPATNQWIQKTDFPAVGRIGAVAITIGSKGYVGLGIIGASSKFKDWWEYDPADAVNGNDANENPKGRWTQKESFGGTARSFAIGFSNGIKGYVGFGNDGSFENDLWEYDPSLGTNGRWTSKSIATGENRTAASSFVIGNKGYIVGGYYISGKNLIFLRNVWEYNIDNDYWIEKHTFPSTSRALACGFAINSKGYFGLGYVQGDSLKNDFWEFTPLAPNRPELDVLSVSDSQVKVSWLNNSTKVTDFRLEQSVDNSINFQQIETLTATSYTFTNLLEGKKYYFRIRAFNGTSYSAYSIIKSVLTLPVAPSRLTIAAASDSEINLNWSDNSSREEGYQIERASADNTNFIAIAKVEPNTTTYKDSNKAGNNILPRSTYYYRIAAMNASGKSAYSSEEKVKTLDLLQAPSELVASSASDSEISVSWKDNSDNETSFLLQRSTRNNSDYTDLISLKANVTSYIDKELTPSTTYFYRIKASNDEVSSSYATETLAVTLITTGANDNIRDNKVIIFPNPTRQSIYISAGEDFAFQAAFELINSTGQLVKKGKLSHVGHLNIDDLNVGVYYLNIYTLKEHILKKIVKY